MYDDAEDDLAYTPPKRRMRLVPLTMVMLSLLLVIKVNELYIGSRQLRELYTARDAVAQQDAQPAATEKAEAAPAEPVDTGKDVAAPATADTKEAPAAAAPAASGEHGSAAAPAEEPKTFGTGRSTVKEIEALKAREGASRFSQSEIDLLENLAKRRDELDKREKELDIKTAVLDATQKRINDRIEEMKTLEAQLSKVIAQYDEKQNVQIASLVKIYESMKPMQAAAIFNELDLPILLEVIDKMSERRVAPVLALMDPKKARDVTQELAAMRKSAPKKPAAAGK